ncbi:hypothetical protein MN116_007563 [Schistosoma mekongi]|uniref:Uncharacterized protein n=1 Tax=Schistosoma mekongi TaxID=38744 RepID=A0AAE2D2F3_SCHME|nr:hypothetical protein MN116_007563 [Schistosoma mekongi]
MMMVVIYCFLLCLINTEYMVHIEEFYTKPGNNVSKNSCCVVDYPTWSDAKLITGAVCITVGFIIELLIILIKRLRTQTVTNNVITILSIILIIIGGSLLCHFIEWKCSLVSGAIAYVTSMIATMLGMTRNQFSMKLLRILFIISCVSIAVGIIFIIVAIWECSLASITCIAWSLVTLISIFATAYYFKLKFDPTLYSILYVCLILWSEFVILFTLIVACSTFMCQWFNKQSNDSYH